MKAAAIDMDGTLIDSMPAWREAERRVFEKRGVPLPTGPDSRLRLLYDPADTAALLGLDIEAAWGEYALLTDEYYAARAAAKPGAEPFLAAARAAGLCCWLVTGSRGKNARAALAHCGLAEYFSRVYSGWDEKTSKEAPGFFQRLAGEMGVAAGELLVVEDSLAVARNAKAAGCRVFGVADSTNEEARAMRGLCERYAADFFGLMDFL